jgi:hypothetical protein
MTRHITLMKRWPERYFSSLSKPVQFMRERELLKRQFKLGKSDTFAKTHKSKWTLQFHKVYPGLKFNKNAISSKTGISRQVLNTVYNRGRRAWQTGGSRPGTTADQWGVARVYKFVLVSKKKAPVSWYKTKMDPNNNLRRK